jgi:hypothetical protein
VIVSPMPKAPVTKRPMAETPWSAPATEAGQVFTKSPEVTAKTPPLDKPAGTPAHAAPRDAIPKILEPATMRIDLSAIPTSDSLEEYRMSLEDPDEDEKTLVAEKPVIITPAMLSKLSAPKNVAAAPVAAKEKKKDLPSLPEASEPVSLQSANALLSPFKEFTPKVGAKDDVTKIVGDIPSQWTIRAVLDRAWKLGIKQ